jgi:anti-sigma factor RsiW
MDDYLDQYLTLIETESLRLHMQECPACQAEYAEQLKLRAQLKSLPISEPSAGFADRALTVAMKHAGHQPQHTVHHRTGFIKGFSTAIAAGLALWIIVGILPVKQNIDDTTVQGVAITVQQVQTVKLAFQTVSALENARITIRLPNNIDIVGYEGKTELAWNTSLKKGDNILKLPIKANTLANGKIVAEIEYGNQRKTIGIDLTIKNPGITMEPSSLNIV